MGRTLGICGPILARVASRKPTRAIKKIKQGPDKQTLWETLLAFQLLQAPVTLESGWRSHEGIIGKDAGDLWPYSREGGSKQAFQDFKTGCLQDQCPTLSLPVLLLRGLDPDAEEGPLRRNGEATKT